MPLPSGQLFMPAGQQGDFGRFDAARQKNGLKGVIDQAREDSPLLDMTVGSVPFVGGAMMGDDISKQWDEGNYKTALGLALLGTAPQGKNIAKAGGAMVDALRNAPESVVKAYKLFRTKDNDPSKLYPLFVNADKEVPVGQWIDAEVGPMSAGGKVKSKLGELAYRPGWHAGDLPIATHIGGKSDPALKAPDYRPDNQVWAEVEMPNDVDWQKVAMERAERNKNGEIIPRTAHITDQIPEGGHYRYKTNPNMTGEWMIGGSMKVNKVLTPEEVMAINEAAGVADLPRFSPLDKAPKQQPSPMAQALRSEPGPAPIYDINGAPIEALSKSEQTKYDKAIKASPAFRKMEAARNGDTILEDTHQFSEPNIIQFEDLLGKRGIPIHGDRTAAGKRLTRLNGIDIPGGVELQGGAPYAHMHGDLGTGYGWASMRDAANKKQTHFRNAAHDTDTDVMGIYTTMGMDGLNFSHMPAEAMVKILREMPMNKAMTKQADNEIRHWHNSDKFVGLHDEAVLDQLLGQNGFPMEGAGALRKALIQTLSKAEYQKAGAPNYFDMMNAMTDPNLGHNVPVGTSGYAVIKGDPSAKTISADNIPDALRHKTYDTVIPGQYQGRMVEQIPDEIMFPSVFKRMREQGKTGLHRSFSIGNSDYQDFNEQWLEGVLNYLRQNGQR